VHQTASHLRELWEYLASFPWLWWLGMTTNTSELRRRAGDANLIAKLLPVIVVPLLTAAVTAYVTVQVLKVQVEMYIENTDRRLQSIEQKLWEWRNGIPGANHNHQEPEPSLKMYRGYPDMYRKP